MHLLLSDIKVEGKHAFAYLSSHLIVGLPFLVLFIALGVTAQLAPDAPFDLEKIDLAFIEESPEFRWFLLDSLPSYLPAASLFLVSCFFHVCFVLPWLLNTDRAETSETLNAARSLLIRESSDSLRGAFEEQSLQSRLVRLVQFLREGEESQSVRYPPLNTILIAFIVTWVVIGPIDGSLRFHEIAAQLIPALTIALAFEARRIKAHELAWSERVMAILAFLALGGGEAAALASVLTDQPRFADLALASIAGGFAAVAEIAFMRRS